MYYFQYGASLSSHPLQIMLNSRRIRKSSELGGLLKTQLRRFGYTHVHRMHSFLDWNTQICAVVILFRGCPYVSFDCMRSFPLCNKGIFLLVMDSDNWRRSRSKASLFRVKLAFLRNSGIRT